MMKGFVELLEQLAETESENKRLRAKLAAVDKDDDPSDDEIVDDGTAPDEHEKKKKKTKKAKDEPGEDEIGPADIEPNSPPKDALASDYRRQCKATADA